MNHQAPTPSLPLKTGITPRNFPTQGRAHAYVHTRVTSAQRNVGIRAPKRRSDDILARKRSKARLVKNLDKLSAQLSTRQFSERLTGRHGEYVVKQELAKLNGVRRRMRECGTRWRVLSCGDHLLPGSAQNLNRCDHRLCPFCAGRRSRKIQRKYLPKIGAFMRHAPVPVTPCLLTLTLAHKDGESAVQSYKRLYDAFKKLIRRKRWKAYFLGGMWAFETVLSKDGCWHSHMHLVVFRKRFVDDLDGLKADWLEITGDSYVLNLQRIDDIKSGVKECLKYMAKPSDFDRMSPDHIRQLLEFRSRRLVSAFGEFAEFCKTYEVTDEDRETWGDPPLDQLENGDPCPECAKPLFERVGTLEEIADVFFQIESRTAKVRARARGAPKIPC